MGQQFILKFVTISILSAFFISFSSKAQQKTSYNKTIINARKIKTIYPKNIEKDFQPKVSSLEMPSPGSAKDRLRAIKKNQQNFILEPLNRSKHIKPIPKIFYP